MGDLFTALNTAGQALDAFQRAIDVTQSNVTNANTPGYVKQVAVMQSIDPELPDRRSAASRNRPQDTRSQFAETAVQQQVSLLGEYQQLQTSLTPLADRLRCLLQQRDSFGAEPAVSKLFKLEYTAERCHRSSNRNQRRSTNGSRVPADGRAARHHSQLHRRHFAVDGGANQSGCRENSSL